MHASYGRLIPKRSQFRIEGISRGHAIAFIVSNLTIHGSQCQIYFFSWLFIVPSKTFDAKGSLHAKYLN